MRPEKSKKKKVLVIGWDAADWKTINPLMDAGYMPALNSLVNQSVISNLATLDPPLSPMLWTSIATGKRPYKHGIIGFAETTADGSTVKPVTINNRKCKAIWNILSEQGYKTHVVGWWPSHPAEKINGVSISNFFQRASRPINEPWVMKEGTVSPPEKAEQFAKMRVHPGELTENHIAAFVPLYGKVDQKKDHSLVALSKIIADNATIHCAATYIMEYEDWDFMAVYYDGIDHFNHAFVKYHPPKQDHIADEDFEIYKNVITAGYRFHDHMLARLLELAGDDCTIVLLSDHGFHPDHMRRQFIVREMAGPASEHSQYGILCVKGEGIKKDEIIYGSSVLDITPTLLTLFDLPVGADMDGKPLISIFEEKVIPQTIETWEAENKNEEPASDISMDPEALQQLIDLGYMEDPKGNKKDAVRNTSRANNFFLARAYMDGNKYEHAIPVLEKLFKESPAEFRFATSLCNCYQKTLQYSNVPAIIEKLKTALKERHEKKKAEQKDKSLPEFIMPAGVHLMEATALISEGKPNQALLLLDKISEGLGSKGKVNLKKATCHLMKRDWSKAILFFNEELKHNYDEPEAHHGLGYALIRLRKPDQAIEHFLNAIGLRFQYPVTHFHLGEAFYKTGQFENALQAFEVALKMEPGMNKARMFISKILKEHLHQPERAREIRNEMKQHIMQTVYVVSGLPRSGTSLMMQLLSAGGMETFSDFKRTADDNNPKGYFEHEAVLRLRRDTKWLDQASGKTVKIISALLEFLPPRFSYKIIFMERDLFEVMNSQQTMLEKSGKTSGKIFPVNIYRAFEENLLHVKKWAEKNKIFVEFMPVKYADLIVNPEPCLDEICKFFNKNLDKKAMLACIDPGLYRSRNIKPVEEKPFI